MHKNEILAIVDLKQLPEKVTYLIQQKDGNKIRLRINYDGANGVLVIRSFLGKIHLPIINPNLVDDGKQIKINIINLKDKKDDTRRVKRNK